MQITKRLNFLGKTGNIISEVFLINILIVGVGLLTNTFIARWFGQENFGIFMYFFSITNMIYLFVSFGLANYVAKLKQSELSRKLFIKIIYVILIFNFLGSAIIYIVGRNLQPQIAFWFWLVFLYSFGMTLFNIVGGALRRLEKFKLAMYFSLFNRIVLIVLVAISALLQNFWLVLLSMSIAIISVILFELPKIKLSNSGASIKTTLNKSIPFLLALLSMQVLYHIDRISIRYLLSFTQLGYFSGYSNFINILRIGAFTIPFVMITKSSRQEYNIYRSLRKLSIVLIPLALIIGFSAPYFVPFLFGPEYAVVNYQLIWMMILSSSLLVIYSLTNSIYLGSKKSDFLMQKIMWLDAFLSVGLNLTLNYYFIIQWGLVGAPLATTITLFSKIILNSYAIKLAEVA
jgi:O-antigen/teichoic acid export membrane protein